MREARTIPFRSILTRGQHMMRRSIEEYALYYRLLTHRRCGLQAGRNIDTFGRHYRVLWGQRDWKPWHQHIEDHGIPCPRVCGPLFGAGGGGGSGICNWHICRDMAIYFTILDVNLDHREEEVVNSYRDQNQAPAPLPIKRYRHTKTYDGEFYVLHPAASAAAVAQRRSKHQQQRR